MPLLNSKFASVKKCTTGKVWVVSRSPGSQSVLSNDSPQPQMRLPSIHINEGSEINSLRILVRVVSIACLTRKHWHIESRKRVLPL